ncbi:anaphase-promoting complex subunit 4 isoform X2 [Cloeon dipterum]|uniref:anaphase-promoting complex subunit 4 isoform X2 n=1 Tax=Cloeon dipterum TaxID=197152 RepID=UPI00321F8C15
MSSSSAMRFLEERHVAIVVDLLVWSHRMDLLALSNVRGEVTLHRLTWQKVWTLAPPSKGVKVTAMAWRPDGKILAIAYSSGDFFLVDVENADVVHKLQTNGEVSCLTWQENKTFEINVAKKEMEENPQLLPPLPTLSRSFGPISKEENAEDSKQINSQTKPNLLVCGTVDGEITMFALGLLSCGTINLSSHLDGQKCHVLSVKMDPSFKNLLAVVAVQNPDLSWVVQLMHFDLSKIEKHSEELLILAKQYGLILSQVGYLGQTMSSITEAWENILMEMDSSLANYASQVEPGAVSADFLELLMFGTASPELQTFLLSDLTERGLKKLGNSIEVSYINIQKLVLKHLQAVSAAIYFHVTGLSGMANEKAYQEIGLCLDLVSEASVSAAAFISKATEVQQVIDSSMKNYKAFFRWLYAAILRLSDERVPPEMVKMRQQELTFIAEFLEKFDDAQEGADGKPKFNLERLGQYLVDKDLTTPKDSSGNHWHQFLNGDPELKNNPFIVPKFENMSLVQQHKHLLSALTRLFEHPSRAFDTPILQTKRVHETKDLAQLRLTTHCFDHRFYMAMIDKQEAADVLRYAEVCLRSFLDPVRRALFRFSDEVEHRVLDVQFFSEETISVLLEQQQDNKMAVFLQFPLKIAVEQALVFFPREGVEATRLLEPNSLKPLENMVGAQIAVNGERKVAVVLSESRRRVRLFEMEVEEDDEEDETTLNSTRESDNTDK